MLETWLRDPYQRWLVNPLARRLVTQVQPYQITVLAGLCGVLVIPSVYFGLTLLAVGLLLLSGYFDTLDGTLARLTQQASPWGSALDIFMDRLVEFCVIVALWLVAPHERALATIIMLGSVLGCVTSFLVVGIFTENQTEKSFHYSPGLMERAEAFAFFLAMLLWPRYFMPLAFAFAGLVGYTAVVRLREFYRLQRHAPVVR